MPKIVRLGGLTVCVSVALLALLAGCKTECKKGTTECVTGSLIRTCVPTNSGKNEWLISQCGANEVCGKIVSSATDSGTAATSDAGAGKDGGVAATKSALTSVIGAATQGQACIGTCTTGDKVCVSDALSKICVNGGVWQLNACDVGKKCDSTGDPSKNVTYGECVVAVGVAGSVKACVAGTVACAGPNAQKNCDADGTGWTTTICTLNSTCIDAEATKGCQPNKNASIDAASACIDATHAARSLGAGKGFELVDCGTTKTVCSLGRCRGSACAVGSTCNGTNQLRDCPDGASFTDTQCGVNEVCQQNGDKASCVPRQCVPGTTVCGDPRDPKADVTKLFTTCVTTPAPVGSGVPEWVQGTCDGNLSCDPTKTGTGNPCAQDCTPDAQRCNNNAVTGINDGKQVCGKDGKWGAVTNCNTGVDSRAQCVIKPDPNASALPVAECAVPICAYALGAAGKADGTTGVCDNGKLRACLPDGSLAAAADCPQGICRNINGITLADGRTPGACDTTPECKKDEERCVVDGTTHTPRYQTCVNGFWSTALSTCANDGLCYDTQDATTGLRTKVCGAECSPNTRKCDTTTPPAKLVTCSSAGKWGTAAACTLGYCQPTGSNDASCIVDCVPGSFQCTGSTVAAGDGSHQGTTKQAQCGSDATWATATDCASGEACRTVASGADIGCVQCVGGSVPGGNEDGVTDSRCDQTVATSIQECGTDNKWTTSRACNGTKTCVGPTPEVCGSCMGAGGSTISVCTDTNLKAEEICSDCYVSTTSGTQHLLQCTDTAIAALATTYTLSSGTATCTGQGFGASSDWAGQTACCGSAAYHTTAYTKLGYNATCAGRGYGGGYGTWGGESYCCDSFPNRTGGTGTVSFAYCK